jgi:hypothetical protein
MHSRSRGIEQHLAISQAHATFAVRDGTPAAARRCRRDECIRENDMSKPSRYFAAAILVLSSGLLSSGLASAQTQTQSPSEQRPATTGQSTGGQTDSREKGVTGAPGSAHPQSANPKAKGAPTVDKGSGNSSLPVQGGR